MELKSLMTQGMDALRKSSAWEQISQSRPIQFALLGLGLVLAFQLIIMPLVHLKQDLDDKQTSSAGDLELMAELSAKYKALKVAASGSSSTAAPETLFATMEDATRRSKVDNYVDFIRPSTRELQDGYQEEEVYIRLKNIVQRDFIRFLHQAEMNSGIVAVKHLRIKKNKDNRFDADVVLTRVLRD